MRWTQLYTVALLPRPPHYDPTEPLLYDLQAVIHHLGTAYRGHYIAFIRGAAKQWYRFNDDKVTPVTEAAVVTSGAYVLSYAKRCEGGVA